MILAAPINREKKAEDWLSGGKEGQNTDFLAEGENGSGQSAAFGTAQSQKSAGLSGTGQGGSQDVPAGILGGQPEDSPVMADSYETFLENRVKEVLARVEGVGEVDVLIVLKSSEQKVYQTDGRTSYSATKEQDTAGGVREITQQEEESDIVLVQGKGQSDGGSTEPLLEKELRPEISGIVISAQGGGIPAVKAEITDAMAALFDLPMHKIKVLKRAE